MVAQTKKNVEVSKDIWEELKEIKSPGESYEDLLKQMIKEYNRHELQKKMKKAEEADREELVPLDELWVVRNSRSSEIHSESRWKTQRIIKENLKKLEKNPYPGKGTGDKEKLPIMGEERYRIHIGRTWTAFYSILEDKKEVRISEILPIDKAHKKYEY